METIEDERIWNNVLLEEGWEYISLVGITKLKKILEGSSEPMFSPDEYMLLYTTTYNMCIQRSPHNYSIVLYERYRETIQEYITSSVLEILKEKHDEFFLIELVKRWSNHKLMVTLLSRFFAYLDREFAQRRSLPGLKEVGLTCFRDMVYKQFSAKARDAVIALIEKERDGCLIDRGLLKNTIDIFVEMGMGSTETYEQDFEAHMLQHTSAYYSRKASIWSLGASCPRYLLKCEESIKNERDRVAHYLHSTTESKLVEALKEAFEAFGNKDMLLAFQVQKSYRHYLNKSLARSSNHLFDSFLFVSPELQLDWLSSM